MSHGARFMHDSIEGREREKIKAARNKTPSLCWEKDPRASNPSIMLSLYAQYAYGRTRPAMSSSQEKIMRVLDPGREKERKLQLDGINAAARPRWSHDKNERENVQKREEEFFLPKAFHQIFSSLSFSFCKRTRGCRYTERRERERVRKSNNAPILHR